MQSDAVGCTCFRSWLFGARAGALAPVLAGIPVRGRRYRCGSPVALDWKTATLWPIN